MTNVVSLDMHRAAPPEAHQLISSNALSSPAQIESDESSCIRAAAALAQVCADWSMILMHRPCLAGADLLVEAKLLVRDLLLVGGIAPPHVGDLPVPTPHELAIRIRALKEKAFELGVMVQTPSR